MSWIRDQGSEIGDQQSAISNQQSAISNQQSPISNLQSPILFICVHRVHLRLNFFSWDLAQESRNHEFQEWLVRAAETLSSPNFRVIRVFRGSYF
jgi:hypothetical protein